MKIIITGSNGFLGQHLSNYLISKSFDVYAFSRGTCRNPLLSKHYHSIDLTVPQAVEEAILAIKPDWIIHTAAMSKPDECHVNRDACLLHNLKATEHLVRSANVVGAKIMYVSTDFIFGEGGPHGEDAIPHPLNFYGSSKLMAESFVKEHAHQYQIMRPVFIYGSYLEGMRPSFIQWVQSNLLSGKTIKVVTDQLRTPSFVEDICHGIALMLAYPRNDDFHLAGKEILSPYEMALKIASVCDLDPALIIPVTADTFPEIVQRAKHSGLLIDKAQELLGYRPHGFEEAVQKSFAKT